MHVQRISCRVVLCLLICLLCGCGVQPIAPAKKSGCQADYVSKTYKLERITFGGGCLRSSTELLTDNIVLEGFSGAQGIIYGRREINGIEWAKVTTREGITGWYCSEEVPAEGQRTSKHFNVMTKNYIVTYPVISGCKPEIAQSINQEIQNYLKVFYYVVGPVGNNLRCRVTYNKQGFLSILFESPFISKRFFEEKEIQNGELWSDITRYCYVAPLLTEKHSQLWYAPKIDLQYAMTFNVNSGKRLDYHGFLQGDADDSLKNALAVYPAGTRVQKDVFYLTSAGVLTFVAEVPGKEFGRVSVQLPAAGRKAL